MPTAMAVAMAELWPFCSKSVHAQILLGKHSTENARAGGVGPGKTLVVTGGVQALGLEMQSSLGNC